MAKGRNRARKRSSGSARKKKGAGRPAGRVLRSRLLAVGIAIVFWGVVWGLLSLRDREISRDHQNRHNVFATRLFLKEIEIALASYREKRGTVPFCRDEENGGAVLFEKLLAGPERFIGPRPDRIRHGRSEDEPSVIIDAWGNPIRYRAGPSLPGLPVTPNPDYDLWSTGGDPDNPREKWVTP